MKDKVNEAEMSQFYWMAAVVVSFVHDGAPMDTQLNVLIHNKEPMVTKKLLNNIQVQAQIQLAKSLGDQLPEVKHVFIQGVSLLGYMTEKEFLGE